MLRLNLPPPHRHSRLGVLSNPYPLHSHSGGRRSPRPKCTKESRQQSLIHLCPCFYRHLRMYSDDAQLFSYRLQPSLQAQAFLLCRLKPSLSAGSSLLSLRAQVFSLCRLEPFCLLAQTFSAGSNLLPMKVQRRPDAASAKDAVSSLKQLSLMHDSAAKECFLQAEVFASYKLKPFLQAQAFSLCRLKPSICRLKPSLQAQAFFLRRSKGVQMQPRLRTS